MKDIFRSVRPEGKEARHESGYPAHTADEKRRRHCHRTLRAEILPPDPAVLPSPYSRSRTCGGSDPGDL